MGSLGRRGGLGDGGGGVLAKFFVCMPFFARGLRRTESLREENLSSARVSARTARISRKAPLCDYLVIITSVRLGGFQRCSRRPSQSCVVSSRTLHRSVAPHRVAPQSFSNRSRSGSEGGRQRARIYHEFQNYFRPTSIQKNPRAHKNKIVTPPPPKKKTKIPPMGMVFPAERTHLSRRP